MIIARLNSEPEIFYSLQGEGPGAGVPAVFLRLAGCNLHCTWCDSKHSWGGGVQSTASEVAQRLLAYPCRHYVITGGEPLLQAEELEELLALLPQEAYIEIETNGTICPTPALMERVDQWNVSPKLPHAGARAAQPVALPCFADMGNAWFKFVVQGEDDWQSIRELGVPPERVLLMPCAQTRKELIAGLPAIADMALRHGVRLCNRLHIILWDDTPGV